MEESKHEKLELEENFLPYDLDYRLPEVKQVDQYYNMKLDMDKVNYNEYYKSPEFFNSKFTGDPSNITGWDKIIEEFVKNAKYPIEGWLVRQNKNENDIYTDEHKLNPDFLELKDSV